VKATRQIKRIRFTGAQNRVGMIYDILKSVGKYGINVLNIEVNPPHIYFKVEWPQELAWHPLVSRLGKEVRGIGELVEVDIMEYEKKEKALDIIGDNISEGILVVDQSGHITYSSKKAREILGISPGEQPDLSTLLRSRQLEPRLPIDEDRDNVEVSITWQGKSTRVVTSIRTITNEEGIPAGALIIFRELDDVRQLIQSVSGPALVDFDDIIGNSQVFTNAINLAKTVAPTNMSVILRGESGTGKELFARAIHKNSARAKGPFVAVNCAAIPDSLLESEFFGYERGAFTGASSGGKQGLFELATHGSLFLDEVGDLSPPLQAKILRAIQEQRIRRVGGRQEIKIDIRIISATNKDLETMVSEGTFREDLFYRLNVIPIWIPPLSDRREDIPILARHFLNTLARELGKPELALTEDAENKLASHKWPGNVRELQNVIQRAAVLANDKVDSTSLIIEGLSSPPLEYGSARLAGYRQKPAAGPEPLSDNQADSPDRFRETFADRLAEMLPQSLPVDLPGLIQEIEKHYLKQAHSKFSSSREIGKFLGISHTAAINKMKRFGIRS
jgi:TyrR family helix-turn-helix protein